MNRIRLLSAVFSLAVFPVLAGAQAAPQATAAAADPTAVWKTLWQPAFDPAKTASVKDLVLARDRARITLSAGTITFTQPLNGVIFGAVFHGVGRLQISAPSPTEEQQLRFFIKQDGLDMEFTEATFSFTDNTFDEIAGKVEWSGAGAPGTDLYANRQQQREDLGDAVLPRVFRSLYSADRPRTAVFVADLKTKDKGWVELHLDALEPEEVRVGRWGDLGIVKIFDTWMSFPARNRSASEAFADPLAKAEYLIRSYKIDATVTGGAELAARTKVTFEPRLAGERVLLFSLDSNLRVDSVKDEQSRALAFFQAREQKDRAQSYGDYIAVALAEPTQAARTEVLEFHYAGKRVVQKVGAGNYFCESFGWYPARPTGRANGTEFAARADFEMTFRSPKQYTLVATGNKVSESREGDWEVTTWKSDPPLAVAGFAFGEYKVYTEKVDNVDVDVYANRQPDDFMRSIEMEVQGVLPGQQTFGAPAIGSLSPSNMAKTMGIEVGNTLRLFQAYFGPYPYKHLSVTNIPYSYGQGWPGLLYLSVLTFLDSTQRNALGLTRESTRLTDFFRAHESSHQWWGHKVSWKSYHDQWLSEGFAEFSGDLYVEFRKNQKEYKQRLHQAREDLGSSDIHNHHYETVGPVWMGQRLSSSESPRAYAIVVYEKGGYVLHMLRMMLYDFRSKNSEQRFQQMMQDFCQTYENKAASTEDFKAIVEKHMTPTMDLENNHRMDWFFREYVYGTGRAQYELHYQVTPVGGKWKLSGTLTRTGVPDNWKDNVPVYVHVQEKAVRLGFIRAEGPQTPFEVTLGFDPVKVSVNDNDDLLADFKQ